MTKRPSKEWLEDLYRKHHRAENLHPDPLVFARGYDDPRDGEVAGLIAAGFAYGQVAKILEALGKVWGVVGKSPREFLETFRIDDVRFDLKRFVYRFHKTEDVVLFFHLLARALETWGSLAELFRAVDKGSDVGAALAGFADRILSGDARPVLRSRSVPAGHPVRFFLASPAGGGAAKRLCLFLRWMVRRDEIDPGYWWGQVSPAWLVVPLDTHVARVGRELGFTSRKASDWKTAREITEALKRYDPEDPIRYDFSLFRYGMTS